MDYSHILWDFNGTILDDVAIGMQSINTLLVARNLPPLRTREEYHRHFRFPIEEYYRSVGFDFEKDPYDLLAHEWITEYRAREHTAPLCCGAKEALEYIRQKNIPQILFSATQRQMLLQQVDDLKIKDYFTEILGSDNIYAEGKISLGRAWAKRVRPAKALLIGDTVHDAMAAAEMGIDCVLISNGHQSRQALSRAKVPLLDNLHGLPAFLEKTKS